MKLEPGTKISIPTEIQVKVLEITDAQEKAIAAENKAERAKKILKLQLCDVLEDAMPQLNDVSYGWNTETMEVEVKDTRSPLDELMGKGSLDGLMKKIMGGRS